MQLFFVFVYFCPQYASYFYMNYVDIKEYYMYIDMQGDNLYILSTCNATYSYILISHIDINRLHVGINEIHFIDKFHIYNNLLNDKNIKLYVDLKSYMSTQIC